MLTEKQFLKGMGILMYHYKDYECPPETVDVYREALKKYLDPQEFEQAVWAHIKLHKWFPKVSEIMDQVLLLRNAGRPSAAERWGQLIIAAERGEGGPTDPATVRALQVCGGWDAFNRMEYKDLDFRRRDFERVYTEALEQEDRQTLLGLEGLQEQKQVTHEP